MFKNIKIVFFDFDDTLWIWKRNVENRNHDDILIKDLNEELIYNNTLGIVPPEMVKLVKNLTNNGVIVFCVSLCNNTLEVNRKRKFLKENYNEEISKNLIGVCSQEEKINIYNAISNFYNIEHLNCAIVDDNIKSLRECKKEKYNIFSSLELITTNQFLYNI